MEIFGSTPIHRLIVEAYRNGAVIAGTSAGATVMSKLMITGKQLLFPDEEGYAHCSHKH